MNDATKGWMGWLITRALAVLASACGGWTVALYCYSAASSSAAAFVTAAVAALAALASAVKLTGTDNVLALPKAIRALKDKGREAGPHAVFGGVPSAPADDGKSAGADDNRLGVDFLAALAVGFAIGTTTYASRKDRYNLLPPAPSRKEAPVAAEGPRTRS